MSQKYILEGHKVVPVDLMTWARWFEAADSECIVAQTDVGDSHVSTVFVGIGGLPGTNNLFETAIFGGPKDGDAGRCDTWEEAEAQHAAVVASLS